MSTKTIDTIVTYYDHYYYYCTIILFINYMGTQVAKNKQSKTKDVNTVNSVQNKKRNAEFVTDQVRRESHV